MSGKREKADSMRDSNKTKDIQATIDGGTALARAVALHLEGKGKEALRELDRAVESGDPPREVYSAKGHIQFELELFEEAVKKLRVVDRAGSELDVRLLQSGGVPGEAGPLEPKPPATSSVHCRATPSGWNAKLGLGICLLHTRSAEKALECFDACLGKTPNEEDNAVRQGRRPGTAGPLRRIARNCTARSSKPTRTPKSRW
ncbi:MAG: hypothetical protein QM757_03780 [Paludibaculum sp.]